MDRSLGPRTTIRRRCLYSKLRMSVGLAAFSTSRLFSGNVRVKIQVNVSPTIVISMGWETSPVNVPRNTRVSCVILTLMSVMYRRLVSMEVVVMSNLDSRVHVLMDLLVASVRQR